MVARALDRWWHDLGRPDPFTVVEAGAGTGTLARAVLFARPACLPALTYVLVERAAALRRRQAEHLALVGRLPGLPARGGRGAASPVPNPASAPGWSRCPSCRRWR